MFNARHAVYPCPNPKTINFATRLPTGELKIEAVSPLEISKRTSQYFEWTDEIRISADDQKTVKSDKLPHFFESIDEKQLQLKLQKMREITNKLAIIYVNDIVGYGVIAIEDIPKNSVVTVYSGVYSFNGFANTYTTAATLNATINAGDCRNFGGFITHAFYKVNPPNVSSELQPSLKDIKPISPLISDEKWYANILSANLVYQAPYLSYKNVAYPFLTNPELIKEGSLLAQNYQLGYWVSQGVAPCLLTLSGEIIDEKSYRTTHHSLNKLIQANKPQKSCLSILVNFIGSFFTKPTQGNHAKNDVKQNESTILSNTGTAQGVKMG